MSDTSRSGVHCKKKRRIINGKTVFDSLINGKKGLLYVANP
jgi:hypothetical protein